MTTFHPLLRFTIALLAILNIVCLALLMVSMIGINNEFSNITFPGCCGLIDGNIKHAEDWVPIIGAPSVCTRNILQKDNALEIEQIIPDAPIYYCSTHTKDSLNTTRCNTYIDGTIEDCLALNGYNLYDLCSESIIN
eukprot:456722_1